jgi:hypothetical protein
MKVCNKFGGCYSQVERQLASGRTCDDIVSNIIQIQLFFTIADFFLVQLAKAKELHKATHNRAFNLEHCWGILKDAPKW